MRRALGVGRHHLSRLEGPGLLACECPTEGLQAGRRRHGGVQKSCALRVAEIRATLPPGTPVEVWFQDEMRVGQKNKLTYRWARKGSRPGPSTINVPNQPTCSARYAPSAEPALASPGPLATPKPCSSISTKSQRKSPPAHTPFSFSIKLDGTAPKTSRLPKTSRSCRCRRVRQSSTLKKTSGRPYVRCGCGGGWATLCDERGWRRIGRA